MPKGSIVGTDFLRVSIETFGVMEALRNDMLTVRIVKALDGRWIVELHNELMCRLEAQRDLGTATPTDDRILEVLRGWIALHNVKVGNHGS